MTRTQRLLLAAALVISLGVYTGGCASNNDAEQFAPAAPTVQADDAEARIEAAEARAAAAEARLAQSSQQPAASAPAPAVAPTPAPAAPSSRSSGSNEVPRPSGVYSGEVNASGSRMLCEIYERTSVARFRGMEVCYAVTIEQHHDGSLYGTGRKAVEVLAGQAPRDLSGSEQTPIEVFGHIDNNDIIHLEYTVQGARRATKGVANYDANPSRQTDNSVYVGQFRTEAANASGRATFSSRP